MEQAFQELPRRADKGASLLVFVVPGPFANQHDPGVLRAFAGHRQGPYRRQATEPTAADLLSDLHDS